jgi:predicted RNase H-like nuclease (RuvC/YqgF family)
MSFARSSRFEDKEDDFLPGPGEYDPLIHVESKRENGPLYNIGTADRWHDDATEPLSEGYVYNKENRGPVRKFDPPRRNDGPDKRVALLEKKLKDQELINNDLKAKIIELQHEKAAKNKEFSTQEMELGKWKGKYDTLQRQFEKLQSFKQTVESLEIELDRKQEEIKVLRAQAAEDTEMANAQIKHLEAEVALAKGDGLAIAEKIQ